PVATNLNSSLENNISNARNINTTLADTTEKSKVATTDAIEKKSQLEKSITKAKEFIEGLDGSQNIPQLRLEVTELQNGLKSNQALEYQGSSISADNTLEGRTEGMKIKGKTMYKKKDGTYTDTWEEGVTLESFGEAEGNKISILSYSKNIWNNVNINIQSENSALIEKNETGFKMTRKITGNDHFGASCIIKLKPRTQYTISSNKSYSKSGLDSLMYIYDDMLFGNKLVSGNEPLTFTTSSNGVAVIGFYFRGAMWKPNDFIVYTNIQLEENSKQSKFENYKEDKKDILIKEPLRSVGDVCDVLYEDNGQVKVYRPTKQYTFTGNERMELSGSQPQSGNYLRIWIRANEMENLKEYTGVNIICNNLPSEY
ncbi:hypothetical protein ACV3QH_18065, partial [Clostridium perfringens]